MKHPALFPSILRLAWLMLLLMTAAAGLFAEYRGSEAFTINYIIKSMGILSSVMLYLFHSGWSVKDPLLRKINRFLSVRIFPNHDPSRHHLR